MLLGLPPLLTGALLRHLDAMGHGDTVLVCDAHFPAERLVARVVEFPAAGALDVLDSVLTVLPLDEPVSGYAMDPEGVDAPVAEELVRRLDRVGNQTLSLPRQEFYSVAQGAFVAVRTGETGQFANILLQKGIVK